MTAQALDIHATRAANFNAACDRARTAREGVSLPPVASPKPNAAATANIASAQSAPSFFVAKQPAQSSAGVGVRGPAPALDPDEAVAARILAVKFCDDPTVHADAPQAAVHAPAKPLNSDDAVVARILRNRFGADA